MDIFSVLKPHCINLDIQEDDKYSVITSITNEIANIYNFDQNLTNEIINDMISREKLMSTGMQYGIAIPHCSNKNIKEPYVYVALSKKGIDFDSTDNTKAKIIVALIVPKQDMNQNVKIMASIARLLNEEKIREKIISANSEQEVVDIFKSIENKSKI